MRPELKPFQIVTGWWSDEVLVEPPEKEKEMLHEDTVQLVANKMAASASLAGFTVFRGISMSSSLPKTVSVQKESIPRSRLPPFRRLLSSAEPRTAPLPEKPMLPNCLDNIGLSTIIGL
jgi:hypothetical protein